MDSRTAVSALAYLTAAGLVAAAGTGTAPAPLPALLSSLGSNVLASGISALCKPTQFGGRKRRDELIANHDILRMVEVATSEAALASAKLYVQLHGVWKEGDGIGLKSARSAPEFLNVLKQLRKEDFSSLVYSAQHLRKTIEESRRALLPARDPQEVDVAANREARNLEEHLIAFVLTVVQNKATQIGRDVEIPETFRLYLAGKDEDFSGGLLGLLSRYVAVYLKTDPRVEAAVLHATLQELVDDQTGMKMAMQNLAELCQRLQESQDLSVSRLLEAFEKRVGEVSIQVERAVQSAFDAGSRPPLSLPYLQGKQQQLGRLVFGARTTALVGREATLESLQSFICEDAPALWAVISGNAGTGKSRVAAELVAMLVGDSPVSDDAHIAPGQWRAGFLREQSTWLGSESAAWRAETDTLLIIDSSARTGEDDYRSLRGFLQSLVDRKETEGLRCRVRVLLLDRLAPDSEQGIARQLCGTSNTLAIDQQQVRTIRWRAEADSPEDSGVPTVKSKAPSQIDPLALHPLGQADALKVAAGYAGRSLTAVETQVLR